MFSCQAHQFHQHQVSNFQDSVPDITSYCPVLGALGIFFWKQASCQGDFTFSSTSTPILVCRPNIMKYWLNPVVWCCKHVPTGARISPNYVSDPPLKSSTWLSALDSIIVAAISHLITGRGRWILHSSDDTQLLIGIALEVAALVSMDPCREAIMDHKQKEGIFAFILSVWLVVETATIMIKTHG